MWGRAIHLLLKVPFAPLFLSAALTAGVVLPLGAADAVVTDVRVGLHAAATRVVLEVTKPVGFTAFTLNNPKRVVIDLPEVGWQLPPEPLPNAIGVFERLRYGLFKPGNSRIVLDIKAPAAITNAFTLDPVGTRNHRLIVDLTPTTEEAFQRSIGAEPIRAGNAQAGAKPDKTALAPPPAAVPQPVVAQPAPPVATAVPLPSSPQTSAFRLAPRKPESRRHGDKHVIVVDPGHGGVDPGTIGISGIYEKHITLSMARELKSQLEATGRFKVLLTRDRDIFIRLRDRVQMAREAKAELFISIHADAVKNKSIRGPSVYTLSEKASDHEAGELAEKENKADLIAGIDLTHETPEVTNILIDLAQRETMNESARYAAILIKEIRKATEALRNSHRFAGFAVLKAPDVPSVLLEMGFLSNPTDERQLKSRQYRGKLAAAVAKSVEAHFVRVEEANRK